MRRPPLPQVSLKGRRTALLVRLSLPQKSRCNQEKRPSPKIKLNPVRVQEFLDRSNITQKDMARLAGISPAYFSQLMNGDRCPSARVRSSLQEVMGVKDFDHLFIVEDDDA